MISPHCVLRPGTELVVVVGAGGHGKVVADALSLMVSDEIDGFIDCNEAIHGTCVLGRPVIAGHDWLFREAEARLIAVALGIGKEFDRQRLWRECTENGIQLLTVIHPDATIASSTVIGEGAVVLAKAVLNAGSQVGRGAIINTAAVIEHDVTIGDLRTSLRTQRRGEGFASAPFATSDLVLRFFRVSQSAPGRRWRRCSGPA